MSEKALRHNTGKLKWGLVDFKSLEPMVEVLEFGAKKYAPFNWQKGLDTTEIVESLLRHCFDYLSGKRIDEESGKPVIGHIQANAMFLAYNERMMEKNETTSKD